MSSEMFDIKKYKFEWSHLAILLVFMFPLFTNTIRHWASSGYVLLALWSMFAMWKYSFDLRKEDKATVTERVVGGIAGYGNCLGCANVLVGKGTNDSTAQCDYIATQDADRGGTG